MPSSDHILPDTRSSLYAITTIGSELRIGEVGSRTLVFTWYDKCIDIDIALPHQPPNILQAQRRIDGMCSFGAHILQIVVKSGCSCCSPSQSSGILRG